MVDTEPCDVCQRPAVIFSSDRQVGGSCEHSIFESIRQLRLEQAREGGAASDRGDPLPGWLL